MGVAYSVVIFAYNEERNIERCIKSVFENSDENLAGVFVLANGCTDSTVTIVRRCQSFHPSLSLVEIDLGDKCNAWNTYVHSLADLDVAVHFFVDGDCWFGVDTFPVLAEKLSSSTGASAVVGFPLSGRSAEMYSDWIRKREHIYGNCYGLTHSFLSLIVEQKFVLPVGLMWIDSALTTIVHRNLDQASDYEPPYTVHVEGHGYSFQSLSPFRAADIRFYLSRIARYQTGKLQEESFKDLSIDAWPRDCVDINRSLLEAITLRQVSLPWYLKRGVVRRLKRGMRKSLSLDQAYSLDGISQNVVALDRGNESDIRGS